MLLHFAVAKLRVQGRTRSLESHLRFQVTDEADDFKGLEASLASFCFPLGAEEVTAKEYMASEVRAGARGGACRHRGGAGRKHGEHRLVATAGGRAVDTLRLSVSVHVGWLHGALLCVCQRRSTRSR